MSLSLKSKITLFITSAVIIVSAVSTSLFITAQKKSIEREVVARGIALSEALSRSVDEGLAAEHLNLIKYVENIVHTDDVVLTQVFSTLWLGVASVPVEQLNVLPNPAAVEYFKSTRDERDHFYKNEGPWIDIYSPVFLDPHDPRVPKLLVGYVRLRVSTAPVKQAIRDAVVLNIFASVLLTFIAVLLLNAVIRKYLLRPVLKLHTTVSKHTQGEFPESVPVDTDDEIGALSSEFNRMSLALREREAKLAEEKERLAVTLRSIGDAVIVTDTQDTITMINRIAEQHTGWTSREAAGKQLSEVFNIINEKTREQCESPAERVIRHGLIVGLANHTVLIKKDGSEIIIEDSAAPIRDKNSVIIGVVLVFRDITAKRSMEEELLKAEKLQSVGLLAGGLAHDFNNILTSIIGNISLAKMHIDPGNKAYLRLAEAEKACKRATDLTYQLLTFSKGGSPIKNTVSIVDIIREAAQFSLSGASVSSEFIIAKDLSDSNVDTGQMSQVFNNLIINAVQAMPNGGRLTFTVNNIVLSENEIPELPRGNYVKVSVKDTGTGIPQEYLTKIFDPYFTTKQTGSGLGLASVYSIIKKHSGHITVESRPSQGTTFHIYLAAATSKSYDHTSEKETIAGGQGRVLFMDDEQIIRVVAGEMLHSLGYEVAYAENGTEAIELYQKALDTHTPYDAVIMDLTIPGGMGGKEAIRKLLELDPKVRAIVSSGYSNDPIMAEHKTYGFKGVITKPYRIENFSLVLSEVIKGEGQE